MLSFGLTRRKLILLFAFIIVVYVGITCLLYGRLEDRIGEVVQHQTVHFNTTTNEESKLCDLSAPLIKSALERAKSEFCRQSLKDTYCFHLDEEIELDNTCPEFDRTKQGQYVGCFNSSSLLTGYHYKFETTNDPNQCLQYCFRAGFELAGLNAGRNCFCGGMKDLATASKVDKPNCEFVLCSGNQNLTCGGITSTMVYFTGLPEMKRMFPKFVELPEDINNRQMVKILFILQLNGRNTRQVTRMLKTIYSKQHSYIVHVDERQNFMYYEMKKLEKEFQKKNISNFKVAKSRFQTIWGGSTLLTMFLDIVKSSLDDKGFNDWDYVLNLSESDMLLLSLEELEHNLALNNGKSFLASHGYNTAEFIRKQGFFKAFHQCDERMWRIKNRSNFPKNIRLDGGSDWIIVHKNLAEIAVGNSLLTKQLQHFFSTVLLPLESFFHTLILNSEHCGNAIYKNLKLTNWNRKQGCRCKSLEKVVDWCGCSPLVFKGSDSRFNLDIVKSKSQFFGRKFDSFIDVEAINFAEENSLRFRKKVKSDVWNCTWINFFERNVDFESRNRYIYEGISKIFFNSWIDGQDFAPCGFDKLMKIYIYKNDSASKPMPILEILDGCGNHFQMLLLTKNLTEVNPDPKMEEFEIVDAEFGTGLDLKEEVFRDVLPVTDVNSKATVLFHWRRNSTFPDSKLTSPLVNVQWWNSMGRLVKNELVKPYDSIYGAQYAEIDLANLTLAKDIIPGLWSLRIPSKDGEIPVVETKFPVFPADRNSNLFEKLTLLFYGILDTCSIERISPKVEICRESSWSTYFPDPKSDLFLY